MVYSANRPRQMARYEYDIFGNCTVYDENNKVNADPNFIGNINPFRWKGFYYDAESGLYYANGSYYDPSTGLYVDAAPIESVIENGLSSNRLDRNGLVCNNILELASNPSTVFNVTELHSDPTYDVTDKFPDWMKRQIKRQEKNKQDTAMVPRPALGLEVRSRYSVTDRGNRLYGSDGRRRRRGNKRTGTDCDRRRRRSRLIYGRVIDVRKFYCRGVGGRSLERVFNNVGYCIYFFRSELYKVRLQK